ncbi:MAG TPA: type II toxin-antitoxin system prevent-host-death family antitoxin [Sphingomicrobium sp.]|nr:type II toxin-antitoxin system prevent-host-death family antitoxin [Sphingomicrobium sp.]
MPVVNIHEAKTHLSRLIERVARGETFVIAKAGRPMVKLVPIGSAEPAKPKRIGFLEGAFKVPEDFDRMGEEEIAGPFDDPS